MTVLGIGRACGGFSLLHAAGCGYGSSVPFKLGTTVMLTDTPSPLDEDESNLLSILLEAWKAKDLPIPEGELGWEVRSDIPIGMGLKSSSALLTAAKRALQDATKHFLSAALSYSIISAVQLRAGVSMTSAVDDIVMAGDWATVWLVDATDVDDPHREVIEMPMKEIFIIIRNQSKGEVRASDFSALRPRFEEVVRLLQRGQPIEAFRLNGHLVAKALGDEEANALCEEIEIRTGCPASVTGSGPAIVVLADPVESNSVEAFLNSLDLEWIRTRMSTDEKVEVVRQPWE